ncbi:MAG TPA: hypothetical protein PLI06_09825 [Methanofastidiosum sp.]|nr:hypothetical protein [Methanofastidiosum sp.]HNU61180.1 hypothetical protein [Methanofastidiosum sp.]HOI77891.1 hypothetical protein [Methanofastidiosum sp.]
MSNELPAISKETLEYFQKSSPDIIKKTVALALKREDEIKHHGKDAPKILTSGMEFTTKMLEAAMSMGEINLLEDEIKWAKDRLPHDGVEMEHIVNRFKIYREVITEILPTENALEVTAYLDLMISKMQKLLD